MNLIQQIAIRTAENATGEKFDQVRIWVCGMPFHADLVSGTMERVLNRIADHAGIEVDDYRKVADQ